jgi:predicted short-subunit dehydrogenase-like oxidoreductase (DUF2520 family)
MKKDCIAIIGTGKVGTALGFLLKKRGYSITALSDLSPETVQRAAALIGAESFSDPSLAAKSADVIFITTPDDIIYQVCHQIAMNGAFRQGQFVIHTSGAMGLDTLADAGRMGAFRASIHPVQSFADIEGALRNLPGSTFGITADEAVKDWAIKIVKALRGIPFIVSEDEKPLYHAAACIASNYVTTLMSYVEEIFLSLGLSSEAGRSTFMPLVRGTLANIEDRGSVLALTGPIARGDMGTILKHLHAFKKHLPHLSKAYGQLGLLTVEMAVRNERLSLEKGQEIRNILEEGGIKK